MRRPAHFRVVAKLDCSVATEGTVTVSDGLFTVRPLRRKRVYCWPLEAVASLVVKRVVEAELKEKRAAKVAARKAKRA